MQTATLSDSTSVPDSPVVQPEKPKEQPQFSKRRNSGICSHVPSDASFPMKGNR